MSGGVVVRYRGATLELDFDAFRELMEAGPAEQRRLAEEHYTRA